MIFKLGIVTVFFYYWIINLIDNQYYYGYSKFLRPVLFIGYSKVILIKLIYRH
jgi:hypothetical protein